jgi:hypothetical protein
MSFEFGISQGHLGFGSGCVAAYFLVTIMQVFGSMVTRLDLMFKTLTAAPYSI